MLEDWATRLERIRFGSGAILDAEFLFFSIFAFSDESILDFESKGVSELGSHTGRETADPANPGSESEQRYRITQQDILRGGREKGQVELNLKFMAKALQIPAEL